MRTHINTEAETTMETEWRTLSEDSRIRARYGFHYIPGNRRPFFQIIADIAEPLNRYNRDEKPATIDGKAWRITGGGCYHEDIAKVFPELAELVRWHLVDDNGTPMHYLANAKYWMEKHLAIFRLWKNSEPEGRKDGEPEPLEAFKSTIVFGACIEDEQRLQKLLFEFGRKVPDTTEETMQKAMVWLKNRAATLRAAMNDCMERFGVERIEVCNCKDGCVKCNEPSPLASDRW